jgi:quinol monooxygenase YgiN
MNVLRHYSLQAAEGRETELGEALAALAAQVRACAGCEKVETAVDARNLGHFIFIETWQDAASRDAAGAKLGKEAFAPVFAALGEKPAALDLLPVG